MDTTKEGWSLDIAKYGGVTHYYKGGVSLCGKAILKKHQTTFDSERPGSKYFKDCSVCIKKLSDGQPKK